MSLGGQLADLDAVLLTHAHPDHVGIAERVRAEAAARVWIHEADARAARTGKAGGKADGTVMSYLFRAELNEDTEQAFAPLDNLAGIGADLLLPGHGGPWTGGVAEAVTRAKAAGRS